jgi:hypothetical protein
MNFKESCSPRKKNFKNEKNNNYREIKGVRVPDRGKCCRGHYRERVWIVGYLKNRKLEAVGVLRCYKPPFSSVEISGGFF